MKAFTDAQYAFKAAVRRAVTLCGGPHAAAELIHTSCPSREGMDAARLSRYGNIDCPEFAPIDVCFALDEGAGKPVIFSAWAELSHPNASHAHDMTLLAGDLAKLVGEAVSTIIVAAADGVTTINEAKAIIEHTGKVTDKVVDINTTARKKMSDS